MPLQPRQKERLLLARKRISRASNWIQRSARMGECYCLWGALFVNSDGMSLHDHRALDQQVRNAIKACGFKGPSLPVFNDAKDRRHEDVIRVLDRAIETA